jgi:hypothetical protein
MNKFIVAVIVSSLFFISCKKENCPAPETPSVVGFWSGKYGSAANYPSIGYAALFRSNGTVRFFNSADTVAATKAEGTYTISGSTVTASYTYIGVGDSYSISATVDSKFTFLEGTYGSGANTTNGGKWFMIKK